ncbi:MAG: PAS domain-containing protein [Bacteroidetes bacterium]|nr:PAS domain-containing protein [Bacteroidota bacterium]
MATQELELILSRQLAECLKQAMFLTDTAGNLVYYNEGAEEILGQKFSDTGPMPVEVWATLFKPLTLEGVPMPPEDLPLVCTLQSQNPHHGSFSIRSLNGELYTLTVTAIPLHGRGNRFLGAMALFWKET